MPKFLEKDLKAEYGAKSKIPYKVMNAKGYMHGNKETDKGAALERKHEEDAKKGKTVAHKGGHPADGHHKGHAPGGPGKTRDGHGSLMDAQRYAHDSFKPDGPMKRHTFHNIQHKRHAEKLACG